MNPGRVALTAAIATVVFWGLKALAIWSAGGLDRSALEGPLFALGLVSLLVTFAALGVHVARSRPVWQRVVGAVAAVVIGVLVFLVVEEAASSLVAESAGWVKEEVGLWVAGILVLVLAVLLTRPRSASA